MAGSFRWPECRRDAAQKPDYRRYCWAKKELVAEAVKCIGCVLLLSCYFYRSIWAVLPMCILGALCWKSDERQKIQKRKQELLLQFCDMIRSVEASMKAGYSVENAFLESYGDMRMMHGRESMICRELLLIRRGLEMNQTLEMLLEDLGKRSGLELIREFAVILTIAKRNGGNIAQVTAATARQIQQQTEVREEILIQTAERRMERNIMSMMPFAILTYIGISNRGYFDVLYHNLQGVLIMSGCLALYLIAVFLSERILERALNIWEQEG